MPTVYIMSNPEYYGAYKIGITDRSVEERAKELSRQTGVLGEFTPVHTINVNDAILAEQIIHKVLKKFRIQSNKEFFEIDLRTAKEILDVTKVYLDQIEQIQNGFTARGIHLDMDPDDMF